MTVHHEMFVSRNKLVSEIVAVEKTNFLNSEISKSSSSKALFKLTDELSGKTQNHAA